MPESSASPDGLEPLEEPPSEPTLAPDAPYVLRPDLGGTGLFARRAWRRGEMVCAIELTPLQATPSRWTLMRDVGEHGVPWPPELRYLQHSCEPTVHVDLDAGLVIASRDIAPGDALTIFYPATEWEMAEVFACGCGAPGCLGRIGGASTLPDEVLDRYTLSRAVRDLRAARRG